MHRSLLPAHVTAPLAVLVISVALCLALATASASHAATMAAAQQAGLEYVAGVGFIDWEKARAVASGTGAPPAKAVNPAQARAAAHRAAVLDARRNLLEVVSQVRIDSQTLVRNLLLENDQVTSRVQGVLERSEILSEQLLADGSLRITVSVPLTGALAREVLNPSGGSTSPATAGHMGSLEERIRVLEARVAALSNALETLASRPQTTPAAIRQDAGGQTPQQLAALDARLRHLESKGGQQTATTAPRAEQTTVQASAPARPTAPALPPATQAEARAATGLIIDARGTGFKPTLRPRIVNGERVLYPSDNMDFDTGVSQGFVRYYRDLAQAQQGRRAGPAPKIIRAQATDDALQVSQADGDFLQNVLAEPGNFLDRCQVVVLF